MTTNVQLAKKNRIINTKFLFACLVAMFAVTMPELAFAGLAKANSGANSFMADIQPIIRVCAIVTVIFCGLAYMNEWVDNRKLFKICAGVVITASATELVTLFW
ncbi:TrbC/VirB2 family protein (plasmid) [Acinetobacter pittii]|uniref:TrbC/VirB2 family protein n=1 Tax=Acinetobacter TaxID=469 RepID=UPI000E2DDDCA|nr:TrbC/VirB2 family protein [Acinetobacter pittii]AZC05408.1 hypothetical protein DKE50_021545 [Acinetobacter nosocomialis]QXA10024.1 TrbC/VirB2 family protein [Acinetobacter pittii]